ncbi:MAG: HD domain-containing protein [Clostridia bacterium]|nr:HD domain-containing protein [Clostridia bacterium]
MQRVMIKDFKDGKISHANVFCMLVDVTQKETRTGSSFIIFTITDGKDEVAARMWDMKRSDFPYEPGNIICVSLDSQMYNGALNFIASSVRAVGPYDGVKEEDFIPSAPIPAQEMYDYIYDTFCSLQNESLKNIGTAIYEDYKEKLLIWPAAQKMHHNIRAGLLYHMYRMLLSAEAAVKAYPEVDAEMVKAGVALHDVGKLEEMTATNLGFGEYTADGTLFGHLYLGMRMIERYGEKLDADEKTVKHLMHIIASHHGKREFGAIQLPQTTEAYIVSELDMLDAQLYIYEKADEELGSGEFTRDHFKF